MANTIKVESVRNEKIVSIAVEGEDPNILKILKTESKLTLDVDAIIRLTEGLGEKEIKEILSNSSMALRLKDFMKCAKSKITNVLFVKGMNLKVQKELFTWIMIMILGELEAFSVIDAISFWDNSIP